MGCAHLQQGLGCRFHVTDGCNLAADQPPCLIQIGRNHCGQWKQLAHQHIHGFVMNQLVSAGGHHHWVKHYIGDAIVADRLGHHMHHFGGMQHANFDGVHANVLHHSVDLGLEHFWRNAMNASNTQCVLRRDGGNGGHAITAQSAESFKVGLNACAA